MPWLVIVAAGLLLGLVTRAKRAAAATPATSGNPPSPSAPITSQVASVPPASFDIFSGYTNRPGGPLVGGVTTERVEGPTQGEQDLGLAESIFGYVKLAWSATVAAVNTAAQAGVQAAASISSSLASAVPVVQAVAGGVVAGFGFAKKSEEGDQQAATGLLAMTPVGVVTLAVTIPKLIEGINQSKQVENQIQEYSREYASRMEHIKYWLPRAVALSDRLDEWYMLPRLSPGQQLQWVSKVNNDATAFIDGWFLQVGIAMDHLRNGEEVGGGIQIIPGRDTTLLDATWAKSVIDSQLLYLACQDFLNRKGYAYATTKFMQGDYLLRHISVAWPSQGVGIIPGAVVSSEVVPGLAPGYREVAVSPTLRLISDRLYPPLSLATVIQYFEMADLGTFHASPWWARLVQSRVLTTLDAVAPGPALTPLDTENYRYQVALERQAQISIAAQGVVETAAREQAAYEVAYQTMSTP